MAQLQLIITADYEIFGNGSGSVDHCMVAPTNRMMEIAESHGARICLFVDVCEYWAFQKAYEDGQLQQNEALKIEEQLKDAILRGHDVQLHFHPQWLNYQIQDGNWLLDQNYWRLASVQQLEGWSLKKLFEKGKQTLEEMLQPVNPDYCCDVFRAGAWCIQPEVEVLKVMKDLGFRIESTVAPGKKYDDNRTVYDFSKVPQQAFWKVSDCVTKESGQGVIMEYPIFTARLNSFQVFRFNLLKMLRKASSKPSGCFAQVDSYYKRSALQKVMSSITPQVRMLNNSDGVTYKEMRYLTGKALERYRYVNGELPLVMIGHPKTFGNEEEFDRYMSWAKAQSLLSFGSYKI